MPTQSCCCCFLSQMHANFVHGKSSKCAQNNNKMHASPTKQKQQNKTTPAAAATITTTTVQIVTPHHARQRVREGEQQQESERSPHAVQRNGRDNDIQLELFAHSQALSRSAALSLCGALWLSAQWRSHRK